MDNKRNSLTVAIILTICLLSGIKLYMEQGKVWIPAVLLIAGFAASFGSVALWDRFDAARSRKNANKEEKGNDQDRSNSI